MLCSTTICKWQSSEKVIQDGSLKIELMEEMLMHGTGKTNYHLFPRPIKLNTLNRTERDCSKWFKTKLTEELKNISLCEYGNCKTTSIEKLEGEMTYCNRKKKHMFFYEIELRVKWEATVDEKTISGQIRAPSICDEESIDSMEVSKKSKFQSLFVY